MDFYDEVMRELVLALGAALFLANAFALYRRRSDSSDAAASRPARAARGESPGNDATDLAQAPVARSVAYMLIGLVVAVWGLASIVTH